MSRIFLVIRAQLLREGLRKLLTDASFSVVGEASTPDDALSFFALNGEEDITLILSEASLCYERTDFLKSLRQVACKARIVILANQEDVPRLGHQNIIAADGVLSLQTSAEVMAQSLRVMQLGERTVPTDFIMSLVGPRAFNLSDTDAPAETADVALPLGEQLPSRRETEILRCLVNGSTNKGIARQLGITEATVKVHLKGLLRKIRASNRTQAAIWAINNGHLPTSISASHD
jgi:two-component system, NarL family, nitrate/nitrite response regulator NarL